MTINRGIFAARMRKSPSVVAVNAFKARVLADSGTFEADACLVNTVKKFREIGLFQRATLMLTPNGYKAAKLYTLIANNGTTDFATTAGGGSRLNASGNRVALAAGTPKLDYTNGSCPEIMVERTATNILLNSETLATQTVTTVVLPYVLSFYGTGTVTVGESTPVVLNGTGENTRVSVVFSSTGGSKNITVSGQVKYAQLESVPLSAVYYNFPSSWIPTTSAAVTRSASTLQKTGLGGLINQSKGAMVFRLTRRGRGRLFGIDDGTDSNSIRIFNPGDSDYLQVLYAKGGVIVNPTISTSVPSEITVAVRYSTNKADFYVNGVLYASLDNNNAPTAVFSRFTFTPTESMTNRIKYFAYIPGDITDSEMILYSTPI